MLRPVGVLGAGSFGCTVASLLSENCDVLLYARNPEITDKINKTKTHRGISFNERVRATKDLKMIADQSVLIFPVIPAENFRDVIVKISPFIKPSHIIIHATKGLDANGIDEDDLNPKLHSRTDISTMTEVITQECSTLRVGCMAGPNLAKEINALQPAATVIASEFDEVIEQGKMALNSQRFFVFGTHDLKAAELAGALKNIIAIGSGILGGRDLGKNLQALLITRGLREMVQIGTTLGANGKAFLGTAGLGDLIATSNSEKSRNYTFGKRIAQGESLDHILKTSDEVAEGVRTLKIAKFLITKYKIRTPIIEMIHRIVFEDLDFDKAMNMMMKYPFAPDVDFI